MSTKSQLAVTAGTIDRALGRVDDQCRAFVWYAIGLGFGLRCLPSSVYIHLFLVSLFLLLGCVLMCLQRKYSGWRQLGLRAPADAKSTSRRRRPQPAAGAKIFGVCVLL